MNFEEVLKDIENREQEANLTKISSISNHAYERYAERIMNKDEKIDISRYVVENKTTIEENIKKMVEYGELIYSGKLTDGKGKTNNVTVYLNGTWIILVDINSKICITLYKVNLGLGEDFNKKYIDGLYEKLLEARKEREEKENKIKEEKNTYKNLVFENELLINEYKNYIKNLENLNRDYKQTIADLEENETFLLTNEREIIETIVGRTRF